MEWDGQPRPGLCNEGVPLVKGTETNPPHSLRVRHRRNEGVPLVKGTETLATVVPSA